MPPIPVAKITPPRSATTCGLPASAHASLAAAMPNCVKRSVRRASFGVEVIERVEVDLARDA